MFLPKGLQENLGNLFESHQALKVAQVQSINQVLENNQVTNALSSANFKFPKSADLPDFLSTLYNCSGLLIGQQCFRINSHISISDDCRKLHKYLELFHTLTSCIIRIVDYLDMIDWKI